MATTISSKTVNAALLNDQLRQLQASASVVAIQVVIAKKALYEHLAELYMWWRSASTVEGYLDAEYAKLGRRFKKKVSHGINFAPLFWLIWGHYNTLTDDKCRRWSIVLNRFDELYQAEKQYRSDSVKKLANYLYQNGGVDGIVNDGKDTDDGEGGEDGVDDEVVDDTDETPKTSIDDKLAQLYGYARDFYAGAPNPTWANFDFTVPTGPDGMGVVLVKKIGDRYQLVGVSNDEALVKPAATQVYVHDYSALPPSICAIVETLSTQCLPSHLQAFYASLLDPAAKGSGDAGAVSVRRLTFVRATGEFLLSPTLATSGVVTIAKPTSPVLANAVCDCRLPSKHRRLIERRLISDRDFNFYTPTSPTLFGEYPGTNLASHMLRLENKFKRSDFMNLLFWPFYQGTQSPPGSQLIVDDASSEPVSWSGVLSLGWFRKLAIEFTSPWLASHGRHIKRAHNRVFMLTFEADKLTAYFVLRDGKFENEQSVSLVGQQTNGKSTAVFVLTKDFAVTTQAIADLSVVTAVELAVTENMLTLQFATAAAQYELHIPTCSPDGKRSTARFSQYAPILAPLASESVEDYYDPTDEAR